METSQLIPVLCFPIYFLQIGGNPIGASGAMAITSAAKNYSDSALTELHFKVLKVSDFLIKIPKVESYYIRHLAKYCLFTAYD